MKVTNYEQPSNTKLHELYVLLNTTRGSVPLERDLGIDPRLVDQPINIIQKNLEYEIRTQVKKYIQNLEIKKVKCNYKNNELVIQCEVEFNG